MQSLENALMLPAPRSMSEQKLFLDSPLAVRKGVCGEESVSSPAGTCKPNHLVSHEGAAPAWAGINFQRVQASSRGCQPVFCGWLCFLSGNAKQSKGQAAAAENASVYLF